MIALGANCLLFKTLAGESVPLTPDMIRIWRVAGTTLTTPHTALTATGTVGIMMMLASSPNATLKTPISAGSTVSMVLMPFLLIPTQR